jgi:glycosyltransferase involved in cell wall biosynthesis
MVVSMKGGLSPFTRRDVQTLVGEGHEVTLLPTRLGRRRDVPPGARLADIRTPEGRLAAAGGLAAALGSRGVTEAFRLARATSAWSSLWLALAYRSTVPVPDVVYSVFGDRKFFVGFFLSLMWDRPLAVTVHAYELYTNPNPRLFKLALARAAVVMTVTEFNRRRLIERWDVQPSKVRVVRVGVDEALFSPEPRFVIMIVGMWNAKKAHEDLLQALPLLGEGYEVWVVGGPGATHTVDVREAVLRLGVSDRCIFFGQVSEQVVGALMRRADLLCCPSKVDPSGNREGFPTVLAEAMYCGLPVVTTDHAEIPAVVPSVVVPEGDPEALAAAIRDYRGDGALAKRDGERNHELAESLFCESQRRALVEALADAVRT